MPAVANNNRELEQVNLGQIVDNNNNNAQDNNNNLLINNENGPTSGCGRVLLNSNRRKDPGNPSTSPDEDVIQRRGKREKRSHIVTRSMDPIILATRKSPIKRPRRDSATLDMIKIFAETPKTPVKSSPSSPGKGTKRRLNTSGDSGIGSASSSPSSAASKAARQKVIATRRLRSRRNLRRLFK